MGAIVIGRPHWLSKLDNSIRLLLLLLLQLFARPIGSKVEDENGAEKEAEEENAEMSPTWWVVAADLCWHNNGERQYN